mmetsp:Transcript_1310/g.1817  ORF Transcript_1310/g.1817 Transcript_1310/m.1817 type:complete len:88 (-) Transcript_1310:151-414(-)
MVPSDARRIAWPICPGMESRSIIAEVAAAAAGGAATAGDTVTATGVCGIGDAIMSRIYYVIKIRNNEWRFSIDLLLKNVYTARVEDE